MSDQPTSPTKKQTAAVTLYTKPACPQCFATKRWLDMRGLDYTLVDMSQDAVAYEYVTKKLGAQQAPVIVTMTGDGVQDHWTGFNPDRLAALIPQAVAA